VTEWSASKLKSWHRCPRRYHHEHILGLDTGTSDRADFGTAFHRHCENRLLAAMDRPTLPDIILADPFEQARLDALWAGYEARWTEDSTWRVLGAEVEFRYELGGHIVTSHKGMDGLIQEADGRTLVLEHKTTGMDTAVGSSYYERLALDVQVSTYMDAAVSLGYEPAGVLYDVAARPRHERKLATPVEDRTLTKGKGCKVCGGKPSGVQGSGKRITSKGCTPAVANDPCPGCPACECPACGGLGWEEAPRLHKGQRDTDETPDEFYARVVEDIASRPDDYYTRVVVTRTEADMQRARASILDTIKLARIAEVTDTYPMNDSSCFAFNSRCPFWLACVGVDDINDRNRFPLKVRP